MRCFGWGISSLLLLLPMNVAGAQTSPGQQAPSVQVNFRSKTSALDAIIAIGLAAHAPIGILPGKDTTALCKTQYWFDLSGVDAQAALESVAQKIQYSLSEEDGVLVLRAPDLTSRQIELVNRRLPEFPGQVQQVTALVSANLATALWATDHPNQGFGGSILHGTDDVRISLLQSNNVTALEVADSVVVKGSGGIWASRIRPLQSDEINDYGILLELYQDQHPLKNSLACTW